MKMLCVGHTATLRVLKRHTLLSTTVLDSADTECPRHCRRLCGAVLAEVLRCLTGELQKPTLIPGHRCS